MRRKTGWALGGVLAGTVLLGATGTFATFSDTESLTATAGAGRMALVDPASQGQEAEVLRFGPDASALVVQPDIQGSGTAELALYAEPDDGKSCNPDLDVTLGVPGRADPVQRNLCALADTGAWLRTVDADTRLVELDISVAVRDPESKRSQKWTGDLRLVLRQNEDGAGFSDEQLVPVELHDPNEQGPKNGGPGNSGDADNSGGPGSGGPDTRGGGPKRNGQG